MFNNLRKNTRYTITAITIALITILTSCNLNPPNTSTQNPTVNTKIQNPTAKVENIKPNKLTIKSGGTTSGLSLPFNTYYCGGSCPVEGSAQFSYKNTNGGVVRTETIPAQVGGASIDAAGNISLSLGTVGGALYGGASSSIMAKIDASNTLTGSVSAPIDTNGQFCVRGGSHRRHDSSSIVSTTYYFRSGNLTLSIDGNDLVASVSGITSGYDSAYTAPWDGSCRAGGLRDDHIATGTFNLRIKNVVAPVSEDTLEVTPSVTDIGAGSDGGVLQARFDLTSSNPSREWKLKVTGPVVEGCNQYVKEYTGTGNNNGHILPDGADISTLANGSYTIEAYYTDKPEDKKSIAVTVNNPTSLEVTIPEGKGLNSEKIFSAKAGGQADFKVKAPSCPAWELKIDGKLPDIVNADGTTTPGQACTFKTTGTGNKDVETWNGSCDKGIMDDGSYTATLKVGSQTATQTVKIDSTPPEIENLEIKETDTSVSLEVTLKDPDVNGVSSGLDTTTVDLQVSDLTLGGTVSKSGNTVSYTIPANGKNNQGKINSLEDAISNGSFSISASDRVKNSLKTNFGAVVTKVYIETEPNYTLTSKGFSTKANSSNDVYITGYPCQSFIARVVIELPYTPIKGTTKVAVRKPGGGTLYFQTISYTASDYDVNKKSVTKRVDLTSALVSFASGDYEITTLGGMVTYVGGVDFPKNVLQGRFTARNIADIKKDAVNYSLQPGRFEHIFKNKPGKKYDEHRFYELISKNPGLGLTERKILENVVSQFDFCTLKDGRFDINYPGGYSINLYGTTILIMAATYDKSKAELKINDMWIHRGIVIP